VVSLTLDQQSPPQIKAKDVASWIATAQGARHTTKGRRKIGEMPAVAGLSHSALSPLGNPGLERALDAWIASR
jgi:hypothetical protein